MIFQSVEFYVIAAFVAAAIIAFFSRPASRGVARQHLLAGNLTPDDDDIACPSIHLHVNDDGSVTLTRRGVSGIGADGAVSLAVNVIGFDIEIQERQVAGLWPPQSAMQARFTLDFLARERYHLSYSSETAGLFAATSLHVRPGITIDKTLQ